ncbi:GNAT family N-acetyltransferase [Rhodococcus qingshengii]|nr:GNAT family N-acetyltransferase [Rhodococcus qingshengii]
MTTSPITCIHDTEIDLAKLGVLLHALAASDETALDGTDFFDKSWASDVPHAPKLIDPHDTPDDPVGGSSRRAGTYRRVVAVKDGEYVGFLAGRFETKMGSAFVAIAAALHPGSGCGPKLLDTFSEMAITAGLTQVRLKPDDGDRHDDRVRFFERYGFDWCAGSTDFMCKPLVETETAPVN